MKGITTYRKTQWDTVLIDRNQTHCEAYVNRLSKSGKSYVFGINILKQYVDINSIISRPLW